MSKASILVCCLAVAIGACAMNLGIAQQPAAPAAAQKWEYATVLIQRGPRFEDDSAGKLLTEKSEQGWEFVSCYEQSLGASRSTTYAVLRRPAQAKAQNGG